MRTRRPAFPSVAVLTVAVVVAGVTATSTAIAQPVPLPPQQPGFLGLVVEASATGAGLRIVDVTPGGPAEQSGLRVNDRLIMMGTIAINSPTDLARGLGGKPAGSTVRIRFVRGGVEGEATVTLGTAPRGFGAPAGRPAAVPGLLPGQAIPALPADATDDGILLGVRTVLPQLRDLLRIKAPGHFTRGALVQEVYPGTPAAQAGIQVDSLIFAVDSRDVSSPAELIRRIRRAEAGSTVVLSVFTAGREEKIKVQLVAPRAAAKPPVAPLPPAAGSDTDLEARIGALERRMTMIEQRLIDLQRTLDAIRQQR